MKKRMIWPIMVVVTLLTVSCSKTDVGSGWLNKMKQAAELSTVQYTVQKVVSNNDESWRIFGDRKILFSFKAVIKAGIDMEKFDATKVRVVESRRDKKKKIWLELPQPRIFGDKGRLLMLSGTFFSRHILKSVFFSYSWR